jgi:uncharacterized membrane protein
MFDGKQRFPGNSNASFVQDREEAIREDQEMERLRLVETGSPLPLARSLWIGALAASIVFDCVGWVTGQEFYAVAAIWILTGAIVTGIAVSFLLFQAWSTIPKDDEDWSTGLWQATSGLLCVMLTGFSWSLRPDNAARPGFMAISLVIIGLTVTLLPAWIWHELLERGPQRSNAEPTGTTAPPTAKRTTCVSEGDPSR